MQFHVKHNIMAMTLIMFNRSRKAFDFITLCLALTNSDLFDIILCILHKILICNITTFIIN